jgi:hypothetical protein
MVLAGLVAGPQAENVTRESPYSGQALEGSVFICSSDAVVAGRFRSDATTGKVVQVAEVTREKRPSAWQIRLSDAAADVVSISGARGERDTLGGRFKLQRSEGAILLSMMEGVNVLTITINLRDSSFVYSGHSLTALMNRVNVFSGSCRPYV